MPLKKVEDQELLDSLNNSEPVTFSPTTIDGRKADALEWRDKFLPEETEDPLSNLKKVDDPDLIANLNQQQGIADYYTELNRETHYNPFTAEFWEQRAANFVGLAGQAIGGVTFGFDDEIASLVGADSYVNFTNAVQQAHPGSSFFGELVGGASWLALGNPAGVVTAGARGTVPAAQAARGTLGGQSLYAAGQQIAQRGLAGRIATSTPVAYGLEGALYGGLYGAGSSTGGLGDRLEGAAYGAAFGAALPVGAIGLFKGTLGSAKLAGRYLLPTEQAVFAEGSRNFINRFVQGYGADGAQRIGHQSLNQIFQGAGKTWIQPTVRQVYQGLDETLVPVTQGGVTKNAIPRIKPRRSQQALAETLDDKLIRQLDDALSGPALRFADAADIRFMIDKMAAKLAPGSQKRASLERLSQSIKLDAQDSASALGIRQKFDFAEKGFGDAAELFSRVTAGKYLASRQAAEKFATKIARGQADDAEVSDLLELAAWSKRHLGTDADKAINELRAEVAYNLLKESPQQAVKALKFQKGREAMKKLFGSDYKNFESLVEVYEKTNKFKVPGGGSLPGIAGIGTFIGGGGPVGAALAFVGTRVAEGMLSKIQGKIVNSATKAGKFRRILYDLYAPDKVKSDRGRGELNKFIQGIQDEIERGE